MQEPCHIEGSQRHKFPRECAKASEDKALPPSGEQQPQPLLKPLRPIKKVLLPIENREGSGNDRPSGVQGANSGEAQPETTSRTSFASRMSGPSSVSGGTPAESGGPDDSGR